MDGTIIQQGRFTSAGTAVTLNVRSDIDWMRVVNLTQAAGSTTATGVEYLWQRGLAANNGVIYFHAAASQVLSMTTSATGIGAGAVGGFTLVDSSVQNPGPLVALTGLSNANPPVVTTGSTATLSTGDIVRLTAVTSAQQVGGIDFNVTVINGTTFSLTNAGAGIVTVAGTTGFWSKIPYQPLFYPRRRVITTITNATSAVVTTTVNHGYTVGQAVRFIVPQVTGTVFGMTQMNGLIGTVTVVNSAASFTVNIDSSAFGTFAWPLSAVYPFSPAEVVPVGEDSTVAPNALDDATVNTGFIGMLLAAGAASPAGQNNDVIYWTAGKSFSVSNS